MQLQTPSTQPSEQPAVTHLLTKNKKYNKRKINRGTKDELDIFFQKKFLLLIVAIFYKNSIDFYKKKIEHDSSIIFFQLNFFSKYFLSKIMSHKEFSSI